MKPLVSILIPAYNAEPWIRETIRSAAGQTWPRKEIIIVDDSSTDNTLKIAREYESKTVKVVKQENAGASAARNHALRLCQGDFIQWLDADDLLAHDKIETQLANKDCDRGSTVLLTSSWGRFFFRPEKTRFIPHSLWQDLPPLTWLLTKFRENVYQHPGAWLVSRKLTELSGPWDERLSYDDDGEYFSRVVSVSEKVEFVREAKSLYRVGNMNSLSWTSEKAVDSFFLATALCIGHLRSLAETAETRAASVQFLQHRIVFVYPDKKEIVKKMNELSLSLGGTELIPRESGKFSVIRKIVGWSAARKIKDLVWIVEVWARKNWEKAMHVLFDRSKVKTNEGYKT